MDAEKVDNHHLYRFTVDRHRGRNSKYCCQQLTLTVTQANVPIL